jgi:hypothetical protein
MLPACRGAFQSERGALYAAMEALRDDYDLVVTHAPTDTNQDHRQVAEEAARVFKAHASLIGGEFPNNDLGGFSPQIYVSLSAREIEAKVGMLARYRSQDFGGRPYLDGEMVRALARLARLADPRAGRRGVYRRRPPGRAGGRVVMVRIMLDTAEVSSASPSVTVLVAAYNEAPIIGTVVREARRAVPSGEVLVVDDGSTDGTDHVAADAGARVLRLSANGGKGAAIRRGLPEARGAVIVLIDGDGQDDPAEIPRLVEALRPDVDLVVGSRFIGTLEPGAITPVNRWGNRFLTSVLNRLFGTQLTGHAGRVQGVPCRHAASGDATRAPVRHRGRPAPRGGACRGADRRGPVRRGPRPHGESRLNSVRDGTRILRRIVALRLAGR